MMSGKASRISELWEGVDSRGWDIRYAAYFESLYREVYFFDIDVLFLIILWNILQVVVLEHFNGWVCPNFTCPLAFFVMSNRLESA